VHVAIKKGRRWKIDRRQQVDFRTYVERVMITEWGPNETNRAQLLAAAIIVKQYAMWYVMHANVHRTDIDENCFDIGSTPVTYQYYRPNATELQEAADQKRLAKGLPARLPLIRAAIDATWNMTLWRTSGTQKGFAHTGYLAGKYKKGCTHYYTGFQLFQQNARRCAEDGESFQAILRRFYGPNIALYTAPAYDGQAPLADPDLSGASISDEWRAGGDEILQFHGDVNGDLLQDEIHVRLRNEGGHTFADAAALQAGVDVATWRDGLWGADLTAAGINPATLTLTPVDVNGDGAPDMLMTDGSGGVWLALTEKRPRIAKVVQTPVMGQPIRVASVAADALVTLWDHDADGRSEIVVPSLTSDGRLAIDLVTVPKSGVPTLVRWWTSAPTSLSADLTGISLLSEMQGIVRGRDRRSIPHSDLLIAAPSPLVGDSSTVAIAGWQTNSATPR